MVGPVNGVFVGDLLGLADGGGEAPRRVGEALGALLGRLEGDCVVGD